MVDIVVALLSVVLMGVILAFVIRLSLESFREKVSKNVEDQMVNLRMEVSQNIHAMQNSVSQGLESAQRTIGDVQQGLGELKEAAKHIEETGKKVASLQDLLQPPKLRGGLGELMLENLLAQVLPAAHYTCQHRFRDGNIVDAMINLGDRLVPVDSKFPLESFDRLRHAETDDERKTARRSFVRDVRRHIDDVSKYIRPDEGTFDFAMMYIPAENVYYEAMVKGEVAEEAAICDYALTKRVIPVSPSCFYQYLTVIVWGLKGLQVEERAQAILAHLDRLNRDFGSFQSDFNTLGTHVTNAKNRYDDASRALDKFSGRLQLTLEGTPTLASPDASAQLLDAPREQDDSSGV